MTEQDLLIQELREENRKLREQMQQASGKKYIEVPCEVGDTVYRINQYARNPIIPMRVIGIYAKRTLHGKLVTRIDCIGKTDMGESCYLEEDFGKRVFLAEQVATEMMRIHGGESNG